MTNDEGTPDNDSVYWSLAIGAWSFSYAVCNARLRNKKSMMFPSCGCSQLRRVVGRGPRLRRSMCVASVHSALNFSSQVMIVPTRVGPIFPSISLCGHFTTVLNG